jgi:hypothetical protein
VTKYLIGRTTLNDTTHIVSVTAYVKRLTAPRYGRMVTAPIGETPNETRVNLVNELENNYAGELSRSRFLEHCKWVDGNVTVEGEP